MLFPRDKKCNQLRWLLPNSIIIQIIYYFYFKLYFNFISPTKTFIESSLFVELIVKITIQTKTL